MKNVVCDLSDVRRDFPAGNWIVVSETDDGVPFSELSFSDRIEAVKKILKTESPAKFAVVSDSSDENELKILNETFVSNDVLKIDAEKFDPEKTAKRVKWIVDGYGKRETDVFFTSDQHFFHKNIVKYCNRPWNSGKDENGEIVVSDSDVEKMNEAMIREWNSVVEPDSTVYALGDFCMGKDKKTKIPELVSKLNGKINLILGNHDNLPVKFYYDAGFEKVYDKPVILNDFVVLSHCPMPFVKAPFFNVYGHVHDCSTYKTWSENSCCVCVERHDYRPVSAKEIENRTKKLRNEN